MPSEVLATQVPARQPASATSATSFEGSQTDCLRFFALPGSLQRLQQVLEALLIAPLALSVPMLSQQRGKKPLHTYKKPLQWLEKLYHFIKQPKHCHKKTLQSTNKLYYKPMKTMQAHTQPSQTQAQTAHLHHQQCHIHSVKPPCPTLPEHTMVTASPFEMTVAPMTPPSKAPYYPQPSC